MQNQSNEKQLHQQFIKQTCESGVVWGLENEDGFAMTSSADFEDSDGKPSEVLCFWSEKDLALACKDDDWKDYKTAKIELGDFMENWCIGMYEDELLVGTNFDRELVGQELDPLDLILELCEALTASGKKIKFENYSGISEFIDEIKSIKNEE